MKNSRVYQMLAVIAQGAGYLVYHIWEWITKCRHRKTYISYKHRRMSKYKRTLKTNVPNIFYQDAISKDYRCIKCEQLIDREILTQSEYKQIQREEKLKRILK